MSVEESNPPNSADLPEGSSPADRREFLQQCLTAAPLLLAVFRIAQGEAEGAEEGSYRPQEHFYGMGIDIKKCIGCGRCVDACKTENNVPREPFYFRTWVERYVITTEGETIVTSPNGGGEGFPSTVSEKGIRRTFFVPKLCNHCASPPCVQVCPVWATFLSQDGVVLVDKDYCIGCRYCIQACPYGARFLDPTSHTAEKCTFCYHRVVKGKSPACVEACPNGARIFGEVRGWSSPLARFTRFNEIQVLKSHLNTEPKVYYANLDGEVR